MYIRKFFKPLLLVTVFIMLGYLNGCNLINRHGKEKNNSNPDLEPFLKSYFASWSRGDMDNYKNHFHEKAVISMLKNGRIIAVMKRGQFVEQQTIARSASKHRMTERMLSYKVDADEQVINVTATWELDMGYKKSRGIDRFIIVRNVDNNLKIIYLLFYSFD